METIKYVRYDLIDGTDTEELISHLSMNGYTFGFDQSSNALFIWEEQTSYLETILSDRSIVFEVGIED